MIGREVIITNKGFEKDELFSYLKEQWDEENYPELTIGKPTVASIDEYILLPATERYMVIIYPKKAGGLFNKKNKVVLSVCDTPAGAKEGFIRALPTKTAIAGIAQIGMTLSAEDERKGPAQDVLLKYTEYVKGILSADGYLA